MATTVLHSNLFNEASHWDDHHPDYAACLAAIGAAAAANQTTTARSLMTIAIHSPAALVFTLEADPGHVCIDH